MMPHPQTKRLDAMMDISLIQRLSIKALILAKNRSKRTQRASIKFRRGELQIYEHTVYADAGTFEGTKATIVVLDYGGNRCDFITLLHTDRESGNPLVDIRLAGL